MDEPTQLQSLLDRVLSNFRVDDSAAKRNNARVAKERMLERVRECEIPETEKVLPWATLLDPPPCPAIDSVRAVMNWHTWKPRTLGSVPLFFGFFGEYGRGKTCALCWVLYHHYASAFYTTCSTMANTPRYKEGVPYWQRLRKARALGIDEVHQKQETDKDVTDLILSRFDEGLITIVAGNCTVNEFINRYLVGQNGKRLADRLEEQRSISGLRCFVEDNGQSFRKKV